MTVPKIITPELAQAMRDMNAADMTLAEAAQKLGMSKESARYRAKLIGIRFRVPVPKPRTVDSRYVQPVNRYPSIWHMAQGAAY